MGFYISPCADELFVSSFHSFEAGIANAIGDFILDSQYDHMM